MTCEVGNSSVGAAFSTFTSALQFLAASTCLIQTKDWPPDADLQDGDVFDFIIVGGGTAGCVLANRLSEVKHWNIALLEAGENPPIESDIPHFDETLHGTKHDWQHKTFNNGRTSQALKDGRINWTKGKMLGGSGSINKMVYTQGNSHDFQSWFDEGNFEWHPNIVRKYFKKAENLQDPISLKEIKVRQHYGHNGPITIDTYNYSKPYILDNLVSAFEEIGIKHVDDLNTANNLGSGILKVTVNEGKRVSTATAYLNPIARIRNNLKIRKKSFVTKIIIDHNLQAHGVEIEQNGKIINLYAQKEIIISAGSINTPQLLMLSGIGPTEHLLALKISPLVHSPMVGQNLQDHTAISIPIFADKPEQVDPYTESFEVLRYLTKRKGFLSYQIYPPVGAFYAEDNTQSYPDHQTLPSVSEKKSNYIKNFASQYINSVKTSLLEQSKNKSLFQFLYILLHPFTRGNISLYSNNPYDLPLIYYDNYKDSRDLSRTITGIKKLTKIISTKYFRSIGAFLGRIKLDSCDNYKLDSTEYWKCVSPNIASTDWHPVGTAKMGTNIHKSVVDSRLRVHGVGNLRVVDASVMPTIPSGNTNAPVIMIAERAADLIKEDCSIF